MLISFAIRAGYVHQYRSDPERTGRKSPKKKRPPGGLLLGKRMARNIYAATKEECEEKLAELIREMKQKIAAIKAQAKAG